MQTPHEKANAALAGGVAEDDAKKIRPQLATANPLILQLNAARQKFEHGLELLKRADDLHELLEWGILNEAQARAAVAEFRRDVAAYKRGRAA